MLWSTLTTRLNFDEFLVAGSHVMECKIWGELVKL